MKYLVTHLTSRTQMPFGKHGRIMVINSIRQSSANYDWASQNCSIKLLLVIIAVRREFFVWRTTVRNFSIIYSFLRQSFFKFGNSFKLPLLVAKRVDKKLTYDFEFNPL